MNPALLHCADRVPNSPAAVPWYVQVGGCEDGVLAGEGDERGRGQHAIRVDLIMPRTHTSHTYFAE